jgi:hypothetical protein
MASFAGKQREEWDERTWVAGGHPDPLLLTELRTRADAYRTIRDCTYEDWMTANADDPQP